MAYWRAWRSEFGGKQESAERPNEAGPPIRPDRPAQPVRAGTNRFNKGYELSDSETFFRPARQINDSQGVTHVGPASLLCRRRIHGLDGFGADRGMADVGPNLNRHRCGSVCMLGNVTAAELYRTEAALP